MQWRKEMAESEPKGIVMHVTDATKKRVDYLVAEAQAFKALGEMRRARELQKESQRLATSAHTEYQLATQRLHVMKALRYGGKEWLEEFLKTSDPLVTQEEIAHLTRMMENRYDG